MLPVISCHIFRRTKFSCKVFCPKSAPARQGSLATENSFVRQLVAGCPHKIVHLFWPPRTHFLKENSVKPTIILTIFPICAMTNCINTIKNVIRVKNCSQKEAKSGPPNFCSTRLIFFQTDVSLKRLFPTRTHSE